MAHVELTLPTPARRVAVALTAHEGAIAWREGGRVLVERLEARSADTPRDVAALLERLPRRRGREAFLVVADARGAELRRLERLPRGLSPAALTRIVHADPRRFFPRDPAPLCIGSVAARDGAHAVAAVERGLLDALATLGAARGARLVGVLPARALLDEDDASQLAVAALDRGTRSPFLVRDPRRARSASATRSGLAAAACALGAAFALAAPPLHDLAAARAAERELDSASAARRRAAAVERELARTAGEVRELDAFARRMPSMTLRLASLARHLEAPTTLRNLQLDSAGGSAVALTPHAADVTDMLAEVPEIANARVVGPIVTEALTPSAAPAMAGPAAAPVAAAESGTQQRVTVRFEWARGARP